MKCIRVLLASILVSSAVATYAAEPAPADSAPARSASELSEGLIYSVDRVPERTFDTARAVEVITISELWRASGMTLGDVLQQEAGLTINNFNAPPSVPIMRGLLGKQVMVLIDGVKVNDAMWRANSKSYLSMVALSQVERIEIVRGVVSVLGTESLGGVINIITRKGPPAGQTFGGTIGLRYTSADGAFATPLQVYGQSDKLRWVLGGTTVRTDDIEAGDGLDQPHTAYESRAYHGSLQYLLSQDKTLSASYVDTKETGVERAWQLAQGANLEFSESPAQLRLGSISYQDLTDRKFADSLRVTLAGNWQNDDRFEVRRATPNTKNVSGEQDKMYTLNLELGTFLGAHHVLYGLDATTETIDSKGSTVNLTTGAVTSARGRYTDGAEYSTIGVYVQDRVTVGKWLTALAGVRYGRFKSSGSEQTPVGRISIDAENDDITGAINLVFHATPHFNVIANGMRGFRAPGIDELSRFSVRIDGADLPNLNAAPEHVKSFELGAKYDSGRFSGSAFFFHNDFTALLVRQRGSLNGFDWLDTDGDGVHDSNEPPIFQLQNVGTAEIVGFEADARYAITPFLQISGNVTKTKGQDEITEQPLDRIPPLFGNARLLFTPASARGIWSELTFLYASAQHRLSAADIASPRIGPNGTDGYRVLNLRGGFTVAERLRLLVGIDNLTDVKYKTHDSGVYRAGRQLVLGTEYRF